ncbi:COPI associated protein, putative [Plasmodium gallinaceum]|uniref:COPI associated protein, putative n=1 Tax=Plasmodium gallinaceum TaxID=5849 RepID=A0A1J1GWU7_PLAGA|nr:COPI associated protein, putative [Plasmodium gallinaceum]CRG97017.1 COPI associated protein, putative [Plasmodium gallinaceum]
MVIPFNNLPNISLRFLSVTAGILMITAGILNIFNLFQIVINIYIICSGILLILCDIKTFRFYRFIEFLFTVVGRCLFILIIGSIIINNSFLNILIGLIIIIISVLYMFLGYYNGIPIPLMDKNNNINSFSENKNNRMSSCSVETTHELSFDEKK